MFNIIFLTCAIVGGTLVLAQLLLSFVAFAAGHGLHFHHHHAASVSGHHGPAPKGFHRARGSARPNAARAARPPSVRKASPVSVSGHWALAWVQSMFNVQGIVAGATVLGLVGLAATADHRPQSVALEFGLGAGFLMMALVSAAFVLMSNMDKDATIDIQQAVGKLATVYLGIPAKKEGQGKITVTLQQQHLEFPAVTFQDAPLLTGQKVVIVAVLEPAVMLVVPEEKYSPDMKI